VNFLAPGNLTAAEFLTKVAMLCVALLAIPLYGQSELTATNPEAVSHGASAVAVQSSPDFQPQNPYLGGIPVGTASPTALSLSLEDAVARGLR